MTKYIYKICPTDIWQAAEKTGYFEGAGIDLADGYIHFSTAEQTAETLALHFASQTGLSLIQIKTEPLDIKWEESRGGQLFPHLYDKLPLSAVTNQWQLSVNAKGKHVLPDLL